MTIALDHPLITPESINQSLVGERISVHRAAIRRDAHDETAHYGLGVAYFNLGLLEESADELTEAARLMPENPNIQFQLAVVLADLAKQGQPGAEVKAVDRLKRTILLQPSHADAHLLMGNIHRLNKQWSDMITSWERVASGASDQVLIRLREFVAERRVVLEKVQRQNGEMRDQVMAAMSQPKSAKGPGTLRRTLGVFFTLFVVSFPLANIQGTLGALVFLASIASLIIVPLVMRSQRRKAGRQATTAKSVMVFAPLPSTVSALLAEARDLDQQIAVAEQLLQAQQVVAPMTPVRHSVRPLHQDHQDWEYAEITANKEMIAVLTFNFEVTGRDGIRKEHRIGNFIADNRFPPKPSAVNKRRFDGLVSQLVREGWQPQGKGSEWYAHRFRRSLD